MHDRRNLEWRLNWYRQSELDGSLLDAYLASGEWEGLS